ncbi:hypothetical protein [Paenibacillus naphthalenovorans]|uniref:Uncharacterized protein n=1 Tax=Paenibacillus naphthalenovorans TaxID=162209 RepID=A0A0U2W3P8_9BACL|nr:hypothetical protein [Paenibacillus naphthalenovorans]ALS22101.1 hypothetical protein IJ22_17270 [Paenibacillus naphthalenovorans]
MTIDQVIELGKINYDSSVFSLDYWIWWVIIILLLIIELSIWLFDSFLDNEEVKGKCILLSVIVFMCLLGWNGLADMNKEEELIEKWKSEVAYPYISKLPEEKREVVYIKIDPELSHKKTGGWLYTYSTEVQRTPLTISFKGNGVETYTNWYETHMELSHEQRPYVTFKRLERDLGHNVNKGLYDVKVYLPDSYQFIEIK